MDRIRELFETKKAELKNWAETFIDDLKFLGLELKKFWRENTTPRLFYFDGTDLQPCKLSTIKNFGSVDEVQAITDRFITNLMSDKELIAPVHLPFLKTEADAEQLGLAPMVYIWNIDPESQTYSLSVNGKCVGHLLEAYIRRSDPKFEVVRDEAMQIIKKRSIAVIARNSLIVGMALNS